jgi:hypothetical protein
LKKLSGWLPSERKKMEISCKVFKKRDKIVAELPNSRDSKPEPKSKSSITPDLLN